MFLVLPCNTNWVSKQSLPLGMPACKWGLSPLTVAILTPGLIQNFCKGKMAILSYNQQVKFVVAPATGTR